MLKSNDNAFLSVMGKSRLVIWAGLVLSGVFLYIVVSKIDPARFRYAISSVSYPHVLACAMAVVASITLRSVRWRVIANKPGSEQSHFAQATNIGVLSNQVFPGRAGEVLRIIMLSRLSSCSLSRAIVSAIIDRAIDVAVLATAALIVYFYLPMSGILEKWLFVLAGVLVVLMSGIWLFVYQTDRVHHWVSEILKRTLRRWDVDPGAFLGEFFSEISELKHGMVPLKIFLVSLCILAVDYSGVALVLESMELDLPIEAPLLLWVFLAAGSALPSAPGYVGIYQVAAVLALSFYGVDTSYAVVAAIVLQLTTLVVSLIMAAPVMISIVSRKFV